MPRTKAKPRRVVGLATGIAFTEKARYATREDRCFYATKEKCHGTLPLVALTSAAARAVTLATRSVIAGVIDGHRGDACAKSVEMNLPLYLADAFDTEGHEAEEALRTSFLACDSTLQKERTGACACVALVDASARLAVGWLGDCRALVARRSDGPLRLTTDHAPDRERERIEAAGGFLHDDGGCWRVGVPPAEGSGPLPESPEPGAEPDPKRRRTATVDLLAACRAFGDCDFKRPKAVVVATPDTAQHQLTADDEFVLLATDGVHESINDACAVAAARAAFSDGGDEDAAARAVVDAAVAAGSTDDVTVVLLRTVIE